MPRAPACASLASRASRRVRGLFHRLTPPCLQVWDGVGDEKNLSVVVGSSTRLPARWDASDEPGGWSAWENERGVNTGWLNTGIGLPGSWHDPVAYHDVASRVVWRTQRVIALLSLAGTDLVLRVPRDKLLDGTLRESDLREFGLTDGLTGVEGVKRQQSVVADPTGRIWFSMNRGLSEVDPARLTARSAPVIVKIESLSADSAPIDLAGNIRLDNPEAAGTLSARRFQRSWRVDLAS